MLVLLNLGLIPNYKEDAEWENAIEISVFHPFRLTPQFIVINGKPWKLGYNVIIF